LKRTDAIGMLLISFAVPFWLLWMVMETWWFLKLFQ